MTPALLTFLTFAAALMAFLGAYSIIMDLYLRDRARLGERLGEESRERQRARIQRSPVYRRAGPKGARGEAGGGRHAHHWLNRMIEQAGLDTTAERLLGIALGCAVAVSLLAGLASGSLVTALLVGLLGFAGPFLFVQVMRRRRQETMLAQLADAFDLVARVIRAGQTVPQAMRAVAAELQPPLATEFAYCSEQQDLGLTPELALRDLAERTGLVEIQIFVVALMVQRQAGGNLAEILENLSNIVRERFRVREKIKVLTAQGRLEAAVLIALPPLMFGAMLYLDPAYTLVLLDHPYPLAAVAVGMVLGILWIRRIVRFDY